MDETAITLMTTQSYVTRDGAQWILDQIKRSYAHELAEKIRNDRTVYAFGPPEQEAYANLIDPEVD